MDYDIFKIEIKTFAQNNCNYKNSQAIFTDDICYDAGAENSVLECYQAPIGKYYGQVS